QLWLVRSHGAAIEILADLLDHSASLERVEKPERHALRQAAPTRDITERERFTRRSKCRQQARRMDDRLHQIRIPRNCLVAHAAPRLSDAVQRCPTTRCAGLQRL